MEYCGLVKADGAAKCCRVGIITSIFKNENTFYDKDYESLYHCSKINAVILYGIRTCVVK